MKRTKKKKKKGNEKTRVSEPFLARRNEFDEMSSFVLVVNQKSITQIESAESEPEPEKD